MFCCKPVHTQPHTSAELGHSLLAILVAGKNASCRILGVDLHLGMLKRTRSIKDVLLDPAWGGKMAQLLYYVGIT